MSLVDAESTSSFGMISPPQGYVISKGHPGEVQYGSIFKE